MTQFHGSIDELKAAVSTCNLNGEWSDAPQQGLHCFRAKSGEILNWWPSKGTLQFQGKNQEVFKELLAAAVGTAPVPTAAPAPGGAKIFVVHGHDREARDQLELVLMRLGLLPFILQNADTGSKTIIEALEQSIYRDAAFAIILLTPDDYGYPRNATEADRQPRARQNVILEMGMVMAALGEKRCARNAIRCGWHHLYRI